MRVLGRVLIGVTALVITTGAATTGCSSGDATAGHDSTTTRPTATSEPAPTSTTTTDTPAPTSTSSATPSSTSSEPPPPPPPPTTKQPPKQAVGAPCLETAKACVDLSANQAWLLRNGKVTFGPTPVTHGMPGWSTPPGTFNVTFKNIDHRSSLFNGAPMPYSVFFNGGIAFHEGSLDSQSHGCVRLTNAAARTFFEALNVGDVVQVVR